ncbi:MAG: 4Fe-4S binding protein [Oscillospiraceae bacterium]
MINKLYFSPTGGTKKVVNLISDPWDAEKCTIDFSLSDIDYTGNFFPKEDICIVGVPSFGGRVPAVALQRLSQMKGENTPTIIVVVYGNRDYDDTLLELKNTLSQNGFNVIAAVAAVSEHSIMPQFGSLRPSVEDEKVLTGFGLKIKEALDKGEALPSVSVTGKVPYREYKGLPLKPKAGKSCTGCGSCAKACPVNAIPLDTPSKTISDKCITCMRCVKVCPNHARKLNPLMLFVAGQKLKKSCSTPKENVLFFK